MKTISIKTFWICITFGVIIRFVFMFLGHNFDFESWSIIGDLVASGKNVYANTARYNYGPVWFTLLGLFWRMSCNLPHNIFIYRVFIVGTLTLADFFIAKIISKRAGNFWGAVFFLNPISLIITGYHNQFDNIAVLIGALGVLCIEESSRQDKFTCSDMYGIIFLSLSLITKHILYAFPIWILFNRNISTRKKFLYAFIPPLLFIVSFMPYWSVGHEGIIQNIFMYRSFNNFPLCAVGIFNHFGINLPFQKYIGLKLFCILMALAAYVFRKENIFDSFMLYTISLVCFSSSIANQYLAIPCMALVIMFRKKSCLYFLPGLLFLSCNGNGLHIPFYLERYGIGFNTVTLLLRGSVMYSVMVWCLLFLLVYYVYTQRMRHKF